MADSQLSIQYSNMNTAIKNLNKQVELFTKTTSDMSTNVTTLCDNWKAQASPIYKADYQKLSKNFEKTTEVVKKLIESTQKYMEDMQAVDKAYAKSKVNQFYNKDTVTFLRDEEITVSGFPKKGEIYAANTYNTKKFK